MRALRFVAAVSLLTALLLACAPSATGGGGGPGSSTSGPKQECIRLQQSAAGTLAAAIDAHRGCAKDDDCAQVGLAASCVDLCARPIAKSGKASYVAAKAQVDGAECKDFEAKGCTFVAPPCVPPRPPRCASGQCTEDG